MGLSHICRNKDALLDLLASYAAGEIGTSKRNPFLENVLGSGSPGSGNYVETIQNLSTEAAALGTQWLSAIVYHVCKETLNILPSFRN